MTYIYCESGHENALKFELWYQYSSNFHHIKLLPHQQFSYIFLSKFAYDREFKSEYGIQITKFIALETLCKGCMWFCFEYHFIEAWKNQK